MKKKAMAAEILSRLKLPSGVKITEAPKEDLLAHVRTLQSKISEVSSLIYDVALIDGKGQKAEIKEAEKRVAQARDFIRCINLAIQIRE